MGHLILQAGDQECDAITDKTAKLGHLGALNLLELPRGPPSTVFSDFPLPVPSMVAINDVQQNGSEADISLKLTSESVD